MLSLLSRSLAGSQRCVDGADAQDPAMGRGAAPAAARCSGPTRATARLDLVILVRRDAPQTIGEQAPRSRRRKRFQELALQLARDLVRAMRQSSSPKPSSDA
jgi:hypothetical protein